MLTAFHQVRELGRHGVIMLTRVLVDPDAIYTLAESYFERFSDKACCFEDLVPYIQFSSEHMSKWTTLLEKHNSAVGHELLTNCEMPRLNFSHHPGYPL